MEFNFRIRIDISCILRLRQALVRPSGPGPGAGSGAGPTIRSQPLLYMAQWTISKATTTSGRARGLGGALSFGWAWQRPGPKIVQHLRFFAGGFCRTRYTSLRYYNFIM